MAIGRFFKGIFSDDGARTSFSERVRTYDAAWERQDLETCGEILMDLPNRARTAADWVELALRARGDFREEVVMPGLIACTDTRQLQDAYFMVSDNIRDIRVPILHRLVELADGYWDWKFVSFFCPEEQDHVQILSDALGKCVEIGEPDNAAAKEAFYQRIDGYFKEHGKSRVMVAGWTVLKSDENLVNDPHFRFWFLMSVEARDGSEPHGYALMKMRELGTAADWEWLRDAAREDFGPDDPYVVMAERELARLAGASMVELRPEETVDLGSGVTMSLTWVPPGTYAMGGGSLGGRDENPVHDVRIGRGFRLAKHPVTQAQFQTVMGGNPSVFPGDDRPVESVTWDEAVEFCRRLTERLGEAAGVYRLPSEAEWEYACRAGSTGPYCYGSDPSRLGEYAWFEDNSGGQTQPVGRKQPNAWGLHDMHGNIHEWCADEWHDNYDGAPADGSPWPNGDGDRMDRGGNFGCAAHRCNSARRDGRPPADRWQFLGFRVARSEPA